MSAGHFKFHVFLAMLAVSVCMATARAQSTTITGTAAGPGGGDDNWNNAANWTAGVPYGTMAAVIQDGLFAQVDSLANTTPTYSGGLTLGVNSKLQIGWTTNYSTNINALGTGPITMNTGSQIISRTGLGTYTFQPVILAGDATIWAGISTANHHTTKTFGGGVSGPGMLTYNGVNNTTFVFNTANPTWTGGFQTADPQNQGHRVKATADGAFGTGDVIINKNCTLYIQAADTIDDNATLFLNGARSSRSEDIAKLILSSSETVASFSLDGLLLPPGQYSSSTGLVDLGGGPLISGTGILTVTSGPLLKLRVDFVTGATTIVGHASQGLAMSYYEITSAGNSLDATGWASLADQDFEGNGPPSGLGDGWEEAGGAGSQALAEAYLLGNSTIPGGQSVSLGMGYDPDVDARDLVFTYFTDTGIVIEGLVEYVTSALPGDVDNDGDVDNADIGKAAGSFTGAGGSTAMRWRDGDMDGDGDVDNADLGLIAGAFTGAYADGASTGAANVPEPASMFLLAAGAAGWVLRGTATRRTVKPCRQKLISNRSWSRCL